MVESPRCPKCGKTSAMDLFLVRMQDAKFVESLKYLPGDCYAFALALGEVVHADKYVCWYVPGSDVPVHCAIKVGGVLYDHKGATTDSKEREWIVNSPFRESPITKDDVFAKEYTRAEFESLTSEIDEAFYFELEDEAPEPIVTRARQFKEKL